MVEPQHSVVLLPEFGNLIGGVISRIVVNLTGPLRIQFQLLNGFGCMLRRIRHWAVLWHHGQLSRSGQRSYRCFTERFH